MLKRVIYIQQYIKGSGYHPSKDTFPNFYTYGFGGRLGRMFKKFNPDWDVEIWRLDSSVNMEIETHYEGIHYKIYPAKGNHHIGIYSSKFFKNLRNLNPGTILNVQGVHDLLLYQIILFSPSSVNITAQHHGENHPLFTINNSLGLKKIKMKIFLWIERQLFDKVKHFFIIDVDHIELLSKTCKALVNKYSLQPIGIDVSEYKRIPREIACSELGLNPEKRYIFYLGQYYKYKEVDRLCEIYKRLKIIDNRIELIVAGGSPNDIYYKNIKECGAIDFGRIPNNELYKYYSVSDVYVSMAFRPDYFGGIGLAMLEAMATGTPVVCKSLENIPENVRQFVGKMPANEDEMIKDIIEVINNLQMYSDCRRYIEILFDHSVLQKNTSVVYDMILKNQLY